MRLLRNAVLIAAVALLMSACAGTPKVKVADIEANPGKYNDKIVTVKGEVVDTYSLPILKQSLVQVDDGTGKIWVKPSERVYFKGDKLEVTGNLKVVGSIAGYNFGFIVFEESEKKDK